MPLRRSPLLTPQSLAARRANAPKSTGPRTPCGKARVSLNGLKHGRSTARAPHFRERLLRAGYPHQEALYGDLRSCLAQAFGARTPYWRAEVDRFATSAWCVVMGRHLFRTKLECALESEAKPLRVLSQDRRKGLVRSLRYRAEDPWRRIGVAFWLQRRRYLTRPRVRRMLRGQEPLSLGPGNEGLENRVRCLVFRLRRPGYFERWRYSLDPNGDPDWSLQPWRNMPGYRERWEAIRQRRPPHPLPLSQHRERGDPDRVGVGEGSTAGLKPRPETSPRAKQRLARRILAAARSVFGGLLKIAAGVENGLH